MQGRSMLKKNASEYEKKERSAAEEKAVAQEKATPKREPVEARLAMVEEEKAEA